MGNCPCFEGAKPAKPKQDNKKPEKKADADEDQAPVRMMLLPTAVHPERDAQPEGSINAALGLAFNTGGYSNAPQAAMSREQATEIESRSLLETPRQHSCYPLNLQLDKHNLTSDTLASPRGDFDAASSNGVPPSMKLAQFEHMSVLAQGLCAGRFSEESNRGVETFTIHSRQVTAELQSQLGFELEELRTHFGDNDGNVERMAQRAVLGEYCETGTSPKRAMDTFDASFATNSGSYRLSLHSTCDTLASLGAHSDTTSNDENHPPIPMSAGLEHIRTLAQELDGDEEFHMETELHKETKTFSIYSRQVTTEAQPQIGYELQSAHVDLTELRSQLAASNDGALRSDHMQILRCEDDVPNQEIQIHALKLPVLPVCSWMSIFATVSITFAISGLMLRTCQCSLNTDMTRHNFLTRMLSRLNNNTL
jgi:hypothetical protein